MANRKRGEKASGPHTIKLDKELRRWVDLLKQRYATNDDTEALRRVILAAHPEIREIKE